MSVSVGVVGKNLIAMLPFDVYAQRTFEKRSVCACLQNVLSDFSVASLACISNIVLLTPDTSFNPHLVCTADSDDAFLEGQSVVVVGAGPAGTCAAMALANAGASVTVYERRSEHTFVQVEGEPYAIVLEKRALDALADAGFLDADFHGSTYAPLMVPCLAQTCILQTSMTAITPRKLEDWLP